jgi:hypothetical protein
MSTNYYEKLVQEDLNLGTSTASVKNPGGGTLTGTQIGLHSFAVGQLKTTTTWDVGSIAVGGHEEKDVTVAGAALLDFAHASLSVDTQGLSLTATVTATNTVTAVLANNTTAAVNLASATLAILVFKSA